MFAFHGKKEKLKAWLKIARLQFYPMSWLAYSLGAVAIATESGRFKLSGYLLGYAALFLTEFCTILTNEYFDFETDRQNRNFSIFTGGARALVEKRLSFRQVRMGIIFGLALTALASVFLIGSVLPGNRFNIIVLLAAGIFLGLGYTFPPIKFSYRGAGEIVVGLTHSIYVILCGYVFQGGSWNDPTPWLLGIPLFFAVFAANILAGIPDRRADQAACKKSIAVLFGPRVSLMAAVVCSSLAFISGLFLTVSLLSMSLSYWFMFVLPHNIVLTYFLIHYLHVGQYEGRINVIMGLALSYIIWFGLFPLISFC